MSKGTWRGKPLDSLTKEQLMDVVVTLSEQQRAESMEHKRQLDTLTDGGDWWSGFAVGLFLTIFGMLVFLAVVYG
jgi:hypothetical protein